MAGRKGWPKHVGTSYIQAIIHPRDPTGGNGGAKYSEPAQREAKLVEAVRQRAARLCLCTSSKPHGIRTRDISCFSCRYRTGRYLTVLYYCIRAHRLDGAGPTSRGEIESMHGRRTSSRWQRAKHTRCGEAASQQVRQQSPAHVVAAAKPGFLFVFCRSGLISAQPLRRIPFEASSAVGSAAGLAVSRGGFLGRELGPVGSSLSSCARMQQYGAGSESGMDDG